MLLYYKDQDGSGSINANELALLATFFDGVPEMGQITLVGTTL